MEGFLSSSNVEDVSLVATRNGVDDCGCGCGGGSGEPDRLGDDTEIDFLGMER